MFAEILVQCEIYDNYVLEYLAQYLLIVHCDIKEVLNLITSTTGTRVRG